MKQALVLLIAAAGLMAAPRAAVTLAFDQGWTGASSSSVPGVVYVSTGWVGKPGFLGWAQLQALQAKGWEIGSSTVNRNLATELAPSELEYELEQGKVDLKAHGIDAVSFASSFGDYNPRTVEAIKQKFGSHIAGEHPKPSASTRKQDAGDAERFAKIAPLAATLNTAPYDRYLLAVRAVKAKTTPAEVAAWLAEAKKANAWLILLVTEPKAPVAAVSAKVKASGLPVVTVKGELSRAEAQ